MCVQLFSQSTGLLLGDVFTAALDPKGLSFLANLPRGSAETELMNVMPVFYVYDYLERAGSWDILAPETMTSRVNMRKRMKEGKTCFCLPLCHFQDSRELQGSCDGIGKGISVSPLDPWISGPYRFDALQVLTGGGGGTCTSWKKQKSSG